MKILVAGGAGFIASHIADAYIKQGHRVVIIDNLSSGKKENINPKAKFYNRDILDPGISKIFKQEKFDLVNHHAAQIDVRKSVSNPIFDARVNILGSLNLLENCFKFSVKKFIFASSGGVMYGECNDVAPSEKNRPVPESPYGISKHTIEHYLEYYWRFCKLPYTIFRYGNVYGPRQDPLGEAGVVAIFSRAMLAGEPVQIFGNGEQCRDYVYVQDVVEANMAALKEGDGEIFNIGTGETFSVNRLFQYLKEIIRYPQNPLYRSPRKGELFKSSLNVQKASDKLDWKAKADFFTGLKKTVEYFKKGRR